MNEKMKKMIVILSDGKIISRERLAEYLGVHWRTVLNYKNKLIQMGYKIESKNGRNGGYRLKD